MIITDFVARVKKRDKDSPQEQRRQKLIERNAAADRARGMFPGGWRPINSSIEFSQALLVQFPHGHRNIVVALAGRVEQYLHQNLNAPEIVFWRFCPLDDRPKVAALQATSKSGETLFLKEIIISPELAEILSEPVFFVTVSGSVAISADEFERAGGKK